LRDQAYGKKLQLVGAGRLSAMHLTDHALIFKVGSMTGPAVLEVRASGELR